MNHGIRLLPSLLVGFLLFGSNGHGLGQIRSARGQYTVKQFALNYISLANNGLLLPLTPLSLSGQNQAAFVPLGFNFTFFGTSYTQVSVSANGLLCFGGATPNASTNSGLGTSNANNCIAAWWDNSVVQSGGIQTATYGSTGTGTFVVQFSNWYHVGNSAYCSSPVQIYLSQNNGRIEVQYSTGSCSYNVDSASVGIQGPAGQVVTGLGCSPSCNNYQVPAKQVIAYYTTPNHGYVAYEAPPAAAPPVPGAQSPYGSPDCERVEYATADGGASCFAPVTGAAPVTSGPFQVLQPNGTCPAVGQCYQNAAWVPLPFNFFYDGRNYSAVSVSTNGLLTFDGLYPTATQNVQIGNPQTPNRYIAPWWNNMALDEISGLTYAIEGSAPNRDVVIQWTNWRHYIQGPCADPNTRQMQVRLYEAGTDALSGGISFAYGTTTAGNPPLTSFQTYDTATVGLEDGAASSDASFVELMCSPNCNEGYRSRWGVTNEDTSPGNWLDGTMIGFIPDPLPNPTWTFLYNNYLGPTAPVGHCGRCHRGDGSNWPQELGVPDALVGTHHWALDGNTPALMYNQLFQRVEAMNDNGDMCSGTCPSPPPDLATNGGSCPQPVDYPNPPDMFATITYTCPWHRGDDWPPLLNEVDGGVSWMLSRLIQPGPQSPGTPVTWMTEPAGGYLNGTEANMPFDVYHCPGGGSLPGSLLMNDPAKSRIKRWMFAGAPNN